MGYNDDGTEYVPTNSTTIHACIEELSSSFHIYSYAWISNNNNILCMCSRFWQLLGIVWLLMRRALTKQPYFWNDYIRVNVYTIKCFQFLSILYSEMGMRAPNWERLIWHITVLSIFWLIRIVILTYEVWTCFFLFQYMIYRCMATDGPNLLHISLYEGEWLEGDLSLSNGFSPLKNANYNI